MKPIRHQLRNAFIPHEGNEFHPHLLRWPWVHAFGGLLILVKVVTIIAVTFYAGRAYQSSVAPSAIIKLSNQARKAQGLAALQSNTLLARAATAKANHMVANNYFAHISPSKVTPWYWFAKAGYRYSSAGENLAIDYISSEDVIQAWLDSPSHRKNLLNSKYKDMGVAVVTGPINGATSIIVVQMFGAPTKTTSIIAAKPKQQPNPTSTKQQLVVQHPVVLGQESPTRTLVAPTVSSPAANSIVRGAPVIVGVAEAGSSLQIIENGKTLESQTVASNGIFSLTLPETLTDGKHTVTLTSTARGQHVSSTLPFTVDQIAPQLVAKDTMVLPSIIGQGVYDVIVTPTSDTTDATVDVSGATKKLVATNGVFSGQLVARPSVSPVIQTQLTDVAGNTTRLPLLDPTIFSTGVVARHGPSFDAVQMIFFSRAFLVLFILVMIAGMAINVSMTWHRQHHPALLPSLLLIYLSGALLFL